MSGCDRFEREGLLRLEQGLPLDEHFETCPECVEARVAYERLLARIAADRPQPPADWKDRVRERLDRPRPARRRRYLLPLGLAAAAAFALVVVRGFWEPAELLLEVAVEPASGEPHRGGEARPGDTLRLRAETGGAAHAELRVYRDDADLVLRCSDEPPCERRGSAILATVALETIGAHRPILLVSDRPIPPPSSGLDPDARRALDAGARVRLAREIPVR